MPSERLYAYPGNPKPRYTRRLSDHILIAFHQACDQANTEVADALLNTLDFIAQRSKHRFHDGAERRAKESLVAAHERIWHLRHVWDSAE